MRFAPLSLVVALAASSGARAGEIAVDLAAPSAGVPGGALPFSLYRPAAAPPQGTRWPVLTLMAGTGSTERDWPNMGHVRETADALIAAGKIRPLVIAMPTGGRSWFVDNPDPGGEGMMATAVTRDLSAHVDATYPTAACRSGRAIAGLSMGGYGALLHAIDHNDDYVAAFSLSGALWAPMPEDPAIRAGRPVRMFQSAYGNPLDWKRFNALNLFPRIQKYLAEKPRASFYMAVGDDDFENLRAANRTFVDALAKGGVDVPFRSDPGGHEWTTWERQLGPALEWLDGRLSSSCGPQ
jgi:enterochelin esterase family protein